MTKSGNSNSGTGSRGRRSAGRRILTILLSSAAVLCMALLACIQIVLSESFLTRTAREIASEYVDGQVGFSDINASVFRSFPNLSVQIDSFSITYPHDRFASFDSTATVSGFPASAGRSPEGDTLASFDRFTLSLNYLSLLTGRVRLRKAELSGPRIFMRSYGEDTANWNILLT